jgi:galactofuranosylgalactofuranosylrhamnosyl-N-acetylglucosaminyl-diphospho-decaprenol beta-1,5/1,6-galactofuranosyltransferase
VTEASTEATEPAPATTGFRVVHTTLMHADQELDVRALYMGGLSGAGGGTGTGRSGGGEEPDDPDSASSSGSSDGNEQMQGYGRVDSAGHVAVEPERRVGFATYFNAFPASYWRRWTDFDSVTLKVRARGHGNVIIYRSTSKGHVLRAESGRIDSAETAELSFDLSLLPFIDGGWYWFEVEAEETEVVLEEAVWGFETDRLRQGRVSIGITTFNRPDFCVDQLVQLSRTPSVLEVIDKVIVVDQGTQKVSDNDQFEQAAAALGDKLQLIEQPNLGGSGGFSRAMSEAAGAGDSDYVLLLDDDVVCELAGVLRAIAFADLASSPTLVGGHMFSLYDRSVLHAYGEALKRYTWFWGPAPGTYHGHDFSRRTLRSTRWLHRRIDVDYNGWWMCLIPTDVIRQIGLSLPMFIKWDDAEFGLRAQEAGFPTVSLPGVAVWHVPWTEKDDTLDWQAYFHERNRLVSALLHSPYERGGRLVRESFENHVKRVMSMQYSTGEIIMRALEDVLDGPERMHRDIVHRLAEVRELRKHYDDGVSEPDLDAFPAPRMKRPPRKGKGVGMPRSLPGQVAMAFTGLARQVLPIRELAEDHPEGIVPHVDQRWWRLAHFDSAIVSTADGTAASWYRRRPRQFRDQMTRSARLHSRLYREWDELAQRYRAALPELVAPETWKATFEGQVDGEREDLSPKAPVQGEA